MPVVGLILLYDRFCYLHVGKWGWGGRLGPIFRFLLSGKV